MTISIVVLAYNRKQSLRELLDHLQVIRPHVAEIVVVDNASDDGTDEMVATEFGWVVYHRNGVNLGACGRNVGIESAVGDVVVTLDDDVFGLGPAELEYIESEFRRDPSLAVLNFRVVDYFTGRLCNWVHHCVEDRAAGRFETYEITEGAAAIRRDTFRAVAGYWPEYFIGHEGPDLAFRVMNLGYTVRYDGRIEVRHKHESAGRASWRFYYYDTRNQIFLAARNMRWPMATRYLAVGLCAMGVYALRDGFVKYWIKGIWDASRNLERARTTRQPMSPETEAKVREIDRSRPAFWSMVRKRLSGAANRLDG